MYNNGLGVKPEPCLSLNEWRLTLVLSSITIRSYLTISHAGDGSFRNRFSSNFCWWLIIPRNLLSSETLIGRCLFSIATVLTVSGPITWALRLWPTNISWCLKNLHFSGFKVIFALVSLAKTLSNLLSCSVSVLPCTKMSSTIQITPSRPSNSVSILL